MHPNAGALLRKQISLFPEHLHNLGDVDCHDPLSSNASNPGIAELSDIQEGEVQEGLEENLAQNRSNLDASGGFPYVISPAQNDRGGID